MALVKCETCGVFFGADSGETHCKKCTSPTTKKIIITGDVEHDKFVNARAMVYDQPHISPDALVSALREVNIDISVKEIMGYVREGRLALVSEDGGSYCASCGKPIMIGTMCKICTEKLEKFRNNVSKVVQHDDNKKTSGMHTGKK